MANENGENDENEKTTETDIFKQQEKTAELLYDVILKQQDVAAKAPPPTQPIYVTRIEEAKKQPPNYLLYIAIGVGVFLMFRT